MDYQYIAYNEGGEIVKGKLAAVSEGAAAEMLSYAGYQIVSLRPFKSFFSLDTVYAALFPPKPNEIILFYRELAMLLDSGISIVTALELLQSQSTNRTMKKVLSEVIADLRSGYQLSVALGKHPKTFSPIYHRLLGIGEQGGNLETELRQIADYMEKEVTTGKNVKNALTYPVITSAVTIMVIGVLVTFVLPAFGNLYNSLGVELPAPVRIMIDTASALQRYGLYLLAALVVVVIALRYYVKTEEGKFKFDKLLLKLPLVGRVRHLSELAKYCRSMALLFSAGLPLTEVISLVIESTRNSAIGRALNDVRQDMVKGEGLSQPMAKHSLFLPMLVQMVRVGEETGNLDVTLNAVANSYEAEAEDRTRSLISLIQPGMTIVIGLVIGFLVLSVTSGIYSMYGQGF
jgi:type IV pilus assembly protein PilC